MLANLCSEAFAEHANGLHNFAKEEHLHQTPSALGQIAVDVAGSVDALLRSNIVSMSATKHVVGVVDVVPRLHRAGHGGEELHHPVKPVAQQQEHPEDEADDGNPSNLGEPESLVASVEYESQ